VRRPATFNVNALVLALIIAPPATGLPEKINSVVWIRRRSRGRT
jgi:Ca2+/Na+ antiporter